MVDSLEQLEYASYQWDADWNGLGGEVVSYVGDAGAELTAGTYRLLVTDEDGCQGQRVFIIETVGSYIPEVTVDPLRWHPGKRGLKGVFKPARRCAADLHELQ